MASFVFYTVTCLCFFTSFLSVSYSQTTSTNCSVQYQYSDCVNVNDSSKKELCLYLHDYIRLWCSKNNKKQPFPTTSKKPTNESIDDLCNQMENIYAFFNVKANNTSNIKNKTSCVKICQSFTNVCLHLETLKNAVQNFKKISSGNTQLKTENVTAVTPSTLTSTMLVGKRQNLTKSNDPKQLSTTTFVTTVNVTSKINIFHTSKIKNVSTSTVLNNVKKKTTNINQGSRENDFNHNETSKTFNAQQKKISNPFPTTSRNEQQKSIDVTNDRNTKQKSLLPTTVYNETPSSAHFMGYFLTAIVLCIAGYIVFHNKQKIIAFIIEGRNQKRSRRPNSGEYKKLQTNVDDVMSSLEKSTASQNYIY